MAEVRHPLVRAAICGLYALTPDLADSKSLAQRVAAAIAGGASTVQYRNKSAPPGLKLEQARTLRLICRDRGALFIVNDDVDVALAVEADGVHLGKDDASIAAARSRLGGGAIIGASCYDELERADAAIASGANYVAFGSFFDSPVKPRAVRASISLLAAAKARWAVPVVAIGGIDASNAALVAAAGADAVAVISALFDAPDVESAARQIAAVYRNPGAARLAASAPRPVS